jgi:hypothetical protein
MQNELGFVKDKLQILQDGGEAKKLIELEKIALETNVNNAFNRLTEEVLDKNNIGYGTKAKDAVQKVVDALGGGVVFQEPQSVNTDQGRRNCLENLRNQKDGFLAIKKAEKDNSLSALLNVEKIQNDILMNIQMIEKIQNALLIGADKFINPDNKEFKTAKGTLTNSLTIISNYSDAFMKHYPTASPILETYYGEKKEEQVISKTQRVESVIDVWRDFFRGKYKGRGFLYWIILGALVDIAGFIFFDIAFTKRD